MIEDESKFFNEENLHPIIYNISYSLGSSLSFILLIIYNLKNKRKNKIINPLLLEKTNINRISLKEKFLWILLVSIVAFISSMINSIFWVNDDNYLNVWVFILFFYLYFLICY